MGDYNDLVNLDALRLRATPFVDTLAFTGSQVVATGASVVQNLLNDNGAFIEIDYINFTGWLNAAAGTNLAYTELLEQASFSTNNLSASYAGVAVKIDTDQRPFVRSKTRVRHVCGSARFWLPLQTKIIVVPGSKLKIELFNDLASTIAGEFSIIGRLIPKQ